MPPKRGRPRKTPVAQEEPNDSPPPAEQTNLAPPEQTAPPPPEQNNPPRTGESTLNEATMIRIISEQIAASIPNLAFELQRRMPFSSGGGNNQHISGGNAEIHTTGTHTNTDPSQKGCTYKYFASSNPPTFSGKEGATSLIKWIAKMEQVLKISQCLGEHKVMYATSSLTEQALTWWNSQIRTLGEEVTDHMTWSEFKTFIMAEYCPLNEIKKLEEAFWNHKMVGAEHQE